MFDHLILYFLPFLPFLFFFSLPSRSCASTAIYRLESTESTKRSDHQQTAMGEENGTRGRYSGDVESKAVDNGQALDIDIGQARTLSADGTPNLLAKHNQLERGLKSRHIQFIALGGAYVFFCPPGRIFQRRLCARARKYWELTALVP